MVKIFSLVEREQMGEISTLEAKIRYPNMAFIMINSRERYSIVDGERCLSGIIGTLYAIADADSLKEYGDLIDEVDNMENVGVPALFNSFENTEGVYYARKK